MRTGALSVIVAASISLTVSAQHPDKPPASTSASDAIVVRGCVSGLLLNDLRERKAEVLSGAETPMVYRLTGDKTMLRQIQKQRHTNVLEVTGVVRSNPNSAGTVRSKRYGNARVYVGAGSQTSSDPGRPPSTPSLRVSSFEVIGPGCSS